MKTNRELLFDAERRLANAGIDSPSVEAAELLAFATNTPRKRLFLSDKVDEEERIAFERLMAKRLNRIPLQHLTGVAPFRHIELRVGPGVFIPRPETELVAEAAIRHLKSTSHPVAADLCSGSGAIAISLAHEVADCTVTAIELSTDAFPWLEENIRESDASERLRAFNADITDFSLPVFSELAQKCDAVTCNPPYIPNGMLPRDVEVREHEPSLALYGGEDGLDVVRQMMDTVALILKPGGLLVVEHADIQGDDGKGGGVAGILREAVLSEEVAQLIAGVPGSRLFTNVSDRQDFNNLPRFAMATRC